MIAGLGRRLRRAASVVGGRGRWRDAVVGLLVVATGALLARAAFAELPWWAVAATVLVAAPALLVPWRWLGTVAVLGLLATQATAVVLAGDDARPWLLPLALSSLLSVLAVEPLERPGDLPRPNRLATASRAGDAAVVVVVLLVAGGVGWAAAADARPSAGLVVLGLAAAGAALVVAVRAHR